eukprot:7240613-Prymnesium_polylepis.1
MLDDAILLKFISGSPHTWAWTEAASPTSAATRRMRTVVPILSFNTAGVSLDGPLDGHTDLPRKAT